VLLERRGLCKDPIHQSCSCYEKSGSLSLQSLLAINLKIQNGHFVGTVMSTAAGILYGDS
jgi:hypothetical protein